jgi:phage replication O-like protein O
MYEYPDAAHTENGYTRIANKLLEAILAAGFSPVQMQTVFAIARMSYGWSRKDVTVSGPELAHRAGVEYSAWFRVGLRDLVAEGVLLVSRAGNSKPGTYRIQKGYGRWGRFASSEADLRRIWDGDHEGEARRTSPKRGARKQARLKSGMIEKGSESCPITDMVFEANGRVANELDRGKETKKPLRGDSKKKEGWVSDFGADWIGRFHGTAEYGRIGAAIKPLIKTLGLEPATIRLAWQAFVASPEAKFGPQYFASHYGNFDKSSKADSRAEQQRKRGIIPHG